MKYPVIEPWYISTVWNGWRLVRWDPVEKYHAVISGVHCTHGHTKQEQKDQQARLGSLQAMCRAYIDLGTLVPDCGDPGCCDYSTTRQALLEAICWSTNKNEDVIKTLLGDNAEAIHRSPL